MKQKRRIAVFLSMVLSFIAIFANSGVMTSAASVDDTVSFDLTATLDETIPAENNFNLEWQYLDSSDGVVLESGNIINFNQGNKAPASVSDTIPTGAVKVKFKLQPAGKEVESVSICGTSLTAEQITALTGPDGYVLEISALDATNAIAVSLKNPTGGGPGDPPPPGPEDPPVNFAYTIKVGANEATAVEFTNVKNGDVITGDFDFSDFTFWITKATNLDTSTDYIITNMGNNSGVVDAEGRNPLEIRSIASGDNYVTLGFEYHPGDPAGYNAGTPAFGINQLTFSSAGYRGVKIDMGGKPDMYDDTVYSDIVDIAAGTQSNPVKAAVYYGSDSIDLSTIAAGQSVTSIEAAPGFNAAAITISGATVRFNSPFYASVPLKVTLSDGTVGYLTIERIGIEIRDYPSGVETLHGSQPGCSLSGVSGTGERNIVATFYYPAADSYSNYNVVAKLTFKDGGMKTVVVNGFAEKPCIDPTLKGGDYLVWAGAQSERPVSVSVTAVKAGATSGSTFGGACFGAGNGVTAKFD